MSGSRKPRPLAFPGVDASGSPDGLGVAAGGSSDGSPSTPQFTHAAGSDLVLGGSGSKKSVAMVLLADQSPPPTSGMDAAASIGGIAPGDSAGAGAEAGAGAGAAGDGARAGDGGADGSRELDRAARALVTDLDASALGGNAGAGASGLAGLGSPGLGSPYGSKGSLAAASGRNIALQSLRDSRDPHNLSRTDSMKQMRMKYEKQQAALLDPPPSAAKAAPATSDSDGDAGGASSSRQRSNRRSLPMGSPQKRSMAPLRVDDGSDTDGGTQKPPSRRRSAAMAARKRLSEDGRTSPANRRVSIGAMTAFSHVTGTPTPSGAKRFFQEGDGAAVVVDGSTLEFTTPEGTGGARRTSTTGRRRSSTTRRNRGRRQSLADRRRSLAEERIADQLHFTEMNPSKQRWHNAVNVVRECVRLRRRYIAETPRSIVSDSDSDGHAGEMADRNTQLRDQIHELVQQARRASAVSNASNAEGGDAAKGGEDGAGGAGEPTMPARSASMREHMANMKLQARRLASFRTTAKRKAGESWQSLLETRGCRACCPHYVHWSHRMKKHVTGATWFKATIMAFIMLASIMVGMQTYSLPKDVEWVMVQVLEPGVQWAFVAECVLKIFAEGKAPFTYFHDGWNLFDFLIVVSSFLPIGASQVTILRMLRLLRVLKLVKALPQLQMLVVSLLNSLSSIGYISLLMGLQFYLYAVLGVIMFGETDPFYFGQLHVALVSLWQAATGDDWSDHLYTAAFGCDDLQTSDPAYGIVRNQLLCHPDAGQGLLLPTLYYVSFQIIAGLMLLNLFVGAVMMAVQDAKDEVASGNILKLVVVRGEDLMAADIGIGGFGGRSDPYVVARVGTQSHTTGVKRNTLNPEWNQEFDFWPLEELGSTTLTLKVYDWDRFGSDDPLGYFNINLAALTFDREYTFRCELNDADKGFLTVRALKHTAGDVRAEGSKRSGVERIQDDLWEAGELVDEITELSKLVQAKRKRERAKQRSPPSLKAVATVLSKFGGSNRSMLSSGSGRISQLVGKIGSMPSSPLHASLMRGGSKGKGKGKGTRVAPYPSAGSDGDGGSASVASGRASSPSESSAGRGPTTDGGKARRDSSGKGGWVRTGAAKKGPGSGLPPVSGSGPGGARRVAHGGAPEDDEDRKAPAPDSAFSRISSGGVALDVPASRAGSTMAAGAPQGERAAAGQAAGETTGRDMWGTPTSAGRTSPGVVGGGGSGSGGGGGGGGGASARGQARNTAAGEATGESPGESTSESRARPSGDGRREAFTGAQTVPGIAAVSVSAGHLGSTGSARVTVPPLAVQRVTPADGAASADSRGRADSTGNLLEAAGLSPASTTHAAGGATGGSAGAGAGAGARDGAGGGPSHGEEW